MTTGRRTPVIIGVGQFLHRATGLDDALEPAALMAEASRAAVVDAGLTSIPGFDSIRVIGLLSWRYGNPARFVAQQLGIEAPQLAVSAMGGNAPQSVLNQTCREIADGNLEIALLTGGESWRTRMRARRDGVELPWPKAADGDEPFRLADELPMHHPAEVERGIVMPIHVYPMFESALRAQSKRSPGEHLEQVGEMWARFSEVAATNPSAWLPQARTASEIITPTPSNRMIGSPYTKMMNSNNDVDMGAALIVCSTEVATQLGVPSDRWVFPHSGTDCHEHPFVSNRDRFTETPAIALGGRRALELAGTTIDEIALIDLYSCFPSAVQLGAQSLGLDPFDPGRQLTRTGGLCFAGGPWNNYVMHAIATVVRELREQPTERAFVWANGGYATKHAFGVYAATPPDQGFLHDSPQDAIDRLPSRELASPDSAVGAATIEAYTVMHDREGAPETVLASCLLADGRRAWASSTDRELGASMANGDWVGTAVHLDEQAVVQLA
jgi:acetyl-CoA C-acetyltransferase